MLLHVLLIGGSFLLLSDMALNECIKVCLVIPGGVFRRRFKITFQILREKSEENLWLVTIVLIQCENVGKR